MTEIIKRFSGEEGFPDEELLDCVIKRYWNRVRDYTDEEWNCELEKKQRNKIAAEQWLKSKEQEGKNVK
jgi:hypothetical protein